MADFKQDGLNVTIKDIEEGKGKVLVFWGIQPNDIDDIVRRLILPGGQMSQGNPSKNVKKVWRRGSALNMILDNSQLDPFVDTGLKSVQSVLLKSGKYDTEEVMHLTDVIGFKADTVTKDEMDKMYKDAKESEIDMWRNYLSNINDEKTRRVLELYSKIYGNTSYGHMLSLANVITIKNLNPDATFVLGQSSWKKFDRGVKRGAKRYPLWGGKPVKEASDADIKAAQEALGHSLTDFNDLSVAVKDAILKQAEQEASDHKWLPYRYIGYDIADTYRIHPNDEDPMTSKPGIISNITRELNALAAEAEAKKNANIESDEDMAQHNEMIERTQRAADEMEKICAENKVDFNDSQNAGVSSHLANMLVKYYSTRVTAKANVLREGNVRQYAEDCAQLTLIMDQIGLDALNQFHHSLQYTQAEAAALAPIMKGVVSRLGRAAAAKVNEGIDDTTEWNKDSFLKKMLAAMKQLGIKLIKGNAQQAQQQEQPQEDTTNIQTPEEFKESFDMMLGRINAVVF